MTAGRGFMALAALIFGRWHPVSALWACLLFGFLDAAAIRLQGVVVPGVGEVPVQLIQALPYLLTVVLLAGFIGKAVASGIRSTRCSICLARAGRSMRCGPPSPADRPMLRW
jgi:ABC-type uncharacterized transport system permease subunit